MRSVIAEFCICTSFLLTQAQFSLAQEDQDKQSSFDYVDLQLVAPNDNRYVAGSLRNGIIELHLDARQAIWRPEIDAGKAVTVAAFAEVGGVAQIPGPFLRVSQGSEVRITVRNSLPDAMPIGLPPPNRRDEGFGSVAGPDLIVRGLRAGTVPDDILRVPRGEIREVRFRADIPGTFLYWADTTNRSMRTRTEFRSGYRSDFRAG